MPNIVNMENIVHGLRLNACVCSNESDDNENT